MKKPTIESFGLSDIGLIRSNNEDVIATLPSHNFFVIADGMGGHKAGEIAAKEATEEVIASLMDLLQPQNKIKYSEKEIISFLNEAITKANKKVFSLSRENISFKGMGTTLCCLHFHHNYFTYAHVGDSRVYLFRQNTLKQLTEDHSLLTELKNTGQINLNEELPPQYKNIITKAVGICSDIEPSINSKKYYTSDKFLLCTDGMSDYLSHDKISSILKENDNNKIAIKKLIEAAKNNGSRDNISGLLIEIKEVK